MVDNFNKIGKPLSQQVTFAYYKDLLNDSSGSCMVKIGETICLCQL